MSNYNEYNNSNNDDDNGFTLFSQSNVNTVRIQNNYGENNCYVNVLIHSAFYLKDLFTAIINIDLSRCPQNMQLLNKFQKVLMQYNTIRLDSNEYIPHLDPTSFKVELAKLFQSNQKYQLNNQEDPIELLILLLSAFHSYHINPSELFKDQDQLCNPSCFIHNLFYLKLIETYKCSQCDKVNSINYDNNYFIYELYVIDVFRHIKIKQINPACINGKLLDYSKSITKQSSEVHCEKHRSETMSKALLCESSSKYLLINLVWNSRNPKVELIGMVYDMISMTISNNDLFEVNDQKQIKQYDLIGLILYWNVHYVCAFNDNGIWLLYDDKKIDQFDSWEELVKYLFNNHYQPICLLYNANGRSNSNTTTTIPLKEQISNEVIDSIKQDKSIPNKVLQPILVVSSEEKDMKEKKDDIVIEQTNQKPKPKPIPLTIETLKPNTVNKEEMKKRVPELFKPFQVESKPKNVIKKQMRLPTIKLDNRSKKSDDVEFHDGTTNTSENKAVFISLPNGNINVNSKNVYNGKCNDNDVVTCLFCHEVKKRNMRKCQCDEIRSHNTIKGNLQLNQEINRGNSIMINNKFGNEDVKMKTMDNNNNKPVDVKTKNQKKYKKIKIV